jgi:hypothetical protein
MPRRLALTVGVGLLLLSLLTLAQQICSCIVCTCQKCQGQCSRAVARSPQPVCATKLQSSMLCVVPQVYGRDGLILPNPNHAAHFASSVAGFQIPLNVSVATELSLRTVATPAVSGVLFAFDPALGVVTRSTQSYGPILTERAETIGRHRGFVSATYQYLNFSSLDGIDLKHLPVVYSHVLFPINGVIPEFEQEFIATENRIDLKAHQIVFDGTFGLTNRIDVSVDVPVLDVRLGITSNALINRVPPQPVPPSNPFFPTTVDGFYHFFNINNPAGSVSQVFSGFKSAAGLGDVIFRVKGTVLVYERARVALGLNVRTPTGDVESFLGSGTIGIKPFVAASYAGRISPHVNLGYEYNGKSVLAGNIATGSAGKLPNQFFYSGGVDIAVLKRLTLASDLLGTRLSSADRVRRSSFVDINGNTHPDIPQTILFRDSVNIIDVSVGAKFRPWRNLLFTGNIAFKANDPGLRANVEPLGSISYSF